MGYYCTVPQCTSLAGKTKNVKFHRFPRDTTMADKWNGILKRGKPYTKYSKVCSLHFTQSDYNVTTMGQWKTLSKDAVPSQNLPKLNPDGTVMVIRKSRTVKYKDTIVVKKENDSVCSDKMTWSVPTATPASSHIPVSEEDSYQPPTAALAPVTPVSMEQDVTPERPKKQDAFMQTDPLSMKDQIISDDSKALSGDERSFSSDSMDYSYVPEQVEKQNYQPKDYSKQPDDYVPQTNEEYNKEAEKYALERKPNFEKNMSEYQKPIIDYQKAPLNLYSNSESQTQFANGLVSKDFERNNEVFGYQVAFDGELRNGQHGMSVLHGQNRPEGQGFFNGTEHIKQEIELSTDEDKYLYSRSKPSLVDSGHYYEAQVKSEPLTVCETNAPQTTYYHHAPPNINSGMYYGPSTDLTRPGPELLIAKQNALAAHTQLWQNTMKRPFFYTESAHYNPQILHTRYEFQDLTRILNQ